MWIDVKWEDIRIGDKVKTGNRIFTVKEFSKEHKVPVSVRGEFIYKHLYHCKKWQRWEEKDPVNAAINAVIDRIENYFLASNGLCQDELEFFVSALRKENE